MGYTSTAAPGDPIRAFLKEEIAMVLLSSFLTRRFSFAAPTGATSDLPTGTIIGVGALKGGEKLVRSASVKQSPIIGLA